MLNFHQIRGRVLVVGVFYSPFREGLKEIIFVGLTIEGAAHGSPPHGWAWKGSQKVFGIAQTLFFEQRHWTESLQYREAFADSQSQDSSLPNKVHSFIRESSHTKKYGLKIWIITKTPTLGDAWQCAWMRTHINTYRWKSIILSSGLNNQALLEIT